MRQVVSGDRPSTHPALFLLEQLLALVAAPPVARGQITLHVNGGRVTSIHAEFPVLPETYFTLQWAPLTPAQQAAAQAVADLLPRLEQARTDCALILSIEQGQPLLPLLFQGRYPVHYPNARPGRSREG